MKDERSIILDLLSEGKITKEEAENLLDALDGSSRKEERSEPKKETNDFSFFDKIGKKITSALKMTDEAMAEGKISDSVFLDDLSRLFNDGKVISKTLTVNNEDDRIKRIYIENTNGSIGLKAWDSDMIEILSNIHFKSSNNYDETKEYLNIKTDDGVLRIESLENKKILIALEIKIPKKYFNEITVKNVNGSIKTEGTYSEILTVENVNGAAKCEDVFSEKIDISTINGSVSAKGINGTDAELSTNNGRIKSSQISCKNLAVKTMNGSIELGEINDQCKNIDASSINSNVKLTLGDINRGVRLTKKLPIYVNASKEAIPAGFKVVKSNSGECVYENDNVSEGGDILNVFAKSVHGSIRIL